LQQAQFFGKLRGVLLMTLCLAGLAGCRSRFVEATIVNQGPALHVLEGHSHTAAGPNVDLGDQGSLLVTISPTGAVTWSPNLTNPK
jgi:hypothetical protein